MKENYNIPLNYKEGTYKAEEITDFACEIINLEYEGSEVYHYILPEHDREVRIYGVPEKPVFTAIYGSDGVIKHIELHRENRIELVYIHFKDNEHAKENIWQYSCYWGDWISEKILERKVKISRLFIDYSDDYFSADFLVNTYTPEDVQQVTDDYNRYIASKGKKYQKRRDYPVADFSGNYRNYPNDSITPDIKTLRVMLMCINPDFVNELYGFAIYVMMDRIKNNVLDKIDKAEDFKFISSQYD